MLVGVVGVIKCVDFMDTPPRSLKKNQSQLKTADNAMFYLITCNKL